MAAPSALFSIEMQLPVSTNALTKNVTRKQRPRSKTYTRWLEAAQNAINYEIAGITGFQKIICPVHAIVEAQRGPRDRDLDNCLKAMFDALQEFHVIKNDNQIVAISVCWAPKVTANRIKVSLWATHEAPALMFQPPENDLASGVWIQCPRDAFPKES